MEDLCTAKRILEEENCTCVLCRGDTVYRSHRRGVAPLLQLLDEGTDVAGFSAADKVVGKATAFLYCLLEVKAVHALVISEPAAQVLQKAGIRASWQTRVPGIRNRQQNGPCPMEQATQSCCTAQEALAAIRQTLARLR